MITIKQVELKSMIKFDKNWYHQYYLDNKERIKIQNKEYRLLNKDKIRERHKKWRLNNREKYNEYINEWQKKHPDQSRIIKKRWYKNNKEHFKEYNRNHFLIQRAKSEAKKSYFVTLKGGKCQKCNQVLALCCYDFHHSDPLKKEIKINFNIMSIEQLYNEINKCILLCSNCHRLEHYNKKRNI